MYKILIIEYRASGLIFPLLLYFIPYILTEKHYNIFCSHVSNTRMILESLEK